MPNAFRTDAIVGGIGTLRAKIVPEELGWRATCLGYTYDRVARSGSCFIARERQDNAGRPYHSMNAFFAVRKLFIPTVFASDKLEVSRNVQPIEHGRFSA